MKNDVDTETLLYLYKFAVSVDDYLANNYVNDEQNLLVNRCEIIIDKLSSLIIDRTKNDIIHKIQNRNPDQTEIENRSGNHAT